MPGQSSQQGADTAPGRVAPRWSNRAAAVFGVGLTFVVMAASGLVLVISPRGRTAQEIDWVWGGLSRAGWEAVHLTTGLVFAVIAVWHIAIHVSVIGNLLFGASPRAAGHRNEALAMLTVVLLFLASAILNFPPASWLVEINEFFKKEYWEPGL